MANINPSSNINVKLAPFAQAGSAGKRPSRIPARMLAWISTPGNTPETGVARRSASASAEAPISTTRLFNTAFSISPRSTVVAETCAKDPAGPR